MQAILLATGETDKLRPLTETIPSPIVPLVNKPIMTYVVELLARQGIKKIFVSLYYLANQIESNFGTGRRWGVRFEYLLQREAWGTAGALKWAESSFNETVIVLPADSIVDIDIQRALEFHKSCNSAMTVAVSCSEKGRDRQIILDSNNIVIGLRDEHIAENPYADIGVYIFEPWVLENIPSRTKFDIHRELIPALLEEKIEIHAYLTNGYWNPMDTFMDYQEAQSFILRNGHKQYTDFEKKDFLQGSSFDGVQISPGIWIAGNNFIHPSARFAPPVFIGKNCRIGRDVEVGPEVVIATDVIIDEDASISKSTILDHTYIGRLVNIENRLVYHDRIIDVETDDHIRITDNFLLSPIYESDVNSGLKRAFDIIVSAFIIVITLPISILIAFLIYPQTGQLIRWIDRKNSNHQFSIMRFNTRNSHNQLIRFGRLIELLELDRLPELFSVLRGDMTMIGVKPLAPDDENQAEEAWQQRRYDCKPGFTGLWYVQTNNDSSLDEIFITDAYYVSTRTGKKDISLLFQTTNAWLRRIRYGLRNYAVFEKSA